MTTTNTETPASTEAIVEALHIQKYFTTRQTSILSKPTFIHAVEDVSLALYPGKATALVGESGSGKSTIARLLARMYDPTQGELRFRGQNINLNKRSTRVLREYRRHVQLIFQDPFSSLNPVHTIRHHLAGPLRIYRHVRSQAEEEELLLALLRRVNLEPAEQFIDKYPHQLSGGQRQRIAIARALAVQPEVLLADEPVSMLDVSIRLDILNLLLSLKDEEKMALLFITHDIASARYFAEETVVMYAGQLVEGGPSDDVIQQPKHPYTQLLISAAPNPARSNLDTAEEPEPLELPARGEIPSLINPPTGCRFHTRCPHVMPVCKERFPERTDLGNGHWTNCFLYSEKTEPAL